MSFVLGAAGAAIANPDSWCPTYNNCSMPDGFKAVGGQVNTPWIYCTPDQPPPYPPRPPYPGPPPPSGIALMLRSSLQQDRISFSPFYWRTIKDYTSQLCAAVNQFLKNSGRSNYVTATDCKTNSILNFTDESSLINNINHH